MMNSKLIPSTLLLLSCVAISACHKKNPDSASASSSASVTASVSAPAVAAAPVELTEEQEAMKKKKELLEYSMMEDQYLNDAKGQWASEAKASSSFGDERKSSTSSMNAPSNATGAPNDTSWSNNQQDMGFDWLELSYAKPVNASEVRAVFPGNHAVESISKVELQDTDGKWNTIWSGVSEQKRDHRGPRTWYIQKFEKTAYKVKAVKLTFANNVSRGYKEVEAVQLVGE